MTMNRRKFLSLGGLGISASLFAACDSRGPQWVQPALRLAERQNQRIESALFRHTAMDTAEGYTLAGRALPSYYISPTVPVWDASRRGPWMLEVTGSVRTPLRLTLGELTRLRAVTHRVNHYCVEGWTAATQWTGVRVSELARLAGVLPDAQYVDFESFDSGYHESWDLESAMHPQTLVAYAYHGRILEPAHGAPARLHSPVKLGYKSTKYLTRVVFLPNQTGGYWSDQGYEWYAGV
ncbi:MAG: COG2041: Sulfite oxidase and related enzymes [uncultured Gemmatimonadetes bacterium]|uniref:COG2041: Sulfite oxidase and related enzymes n=1 Tax=uncultured Gemmatimonadota bacterium TaxID=203437 RepID=A0A6J4LPL5_9BACT|nr:MAG: COG2041: Sulfite oxidase and related enzymes [uncultured Gemmatimonadota bacterium]